MADQLSGCGLHDMKAGDAGRDVEKRTSPVKVASTTVVPKDEMHSAASAARARHVDAPPILENNRHVRPEESCGIQDRWPSSSRSERSSTPTAFGYAAELKGAQPQASCFKCMCIDEDVNNAASQDRELGISQPKGGMHARMSVCLDDAHSLNGSIEATATHHIT